MGYHLNCLEPVFMAGPKPVPTEIGIHHKLESCVLPGDEINNLLSGSILFYFSRVQKKVEYFDPNILS